MAVAAAQDVPRVEAHPRLARHERVVGEARIGSGVGHHEGGVLEDRMAANRRMARNLAPRHAHAGLEPLAVGVDQADAGHRHAEDPARQPCEAVEALFGGRVQDGERAQGAQAGSFVGRQGRGLHGTFKQEGDRGAVTPCYLRGIPIASPSSR
ncbi:hypothetical protein D3C72_1232450 [compost metagenome]